MQELTTYGRDAGIGGAIQHIGPWEPLLVPSGVTLASWLQRQYPPRPQTIRLIGHARGSWGHLLRVEFWTSHGDFLTVNYSPGATLDWPGDWYDWTAHNASAYRYTGSKGPLEHYLYEVTGLPR